MERHNQAITKIAASVRKFYQLKKPFRIYHGSTNTTRECAFQKDKMVDTSPLSYVLNVDNEKRTALVEPNVPMDRLVETTMKYGLVPPVVMEFPGITVGGGYAGTSGESSSFKWGFFNRTINYVEMVLANGEIVKASEYENADLFHGAAGAVGSLGVVTLVEIQLIEAKKYVETKYYPVSSMDEAIQKIEEAIANPELDYVDGILFSKTQGAIITGCLTDNLKENVAIQHFSSATDPWFFLHVKDAVTKRKTGPTTEMIPLEEYLFRYDRGGFWVGVAPFKYWPFPFNRFTRWFLDDFLHTRMLYRALHASGRSNQYMVQDLALPFATAKQFVDFIDEEFGIWPLWLCPLRQSPLPTIHPHIAETEAECKTLKPMLNIGLWGQGSTNRESFVEANVRLEHKLRELGGMKWLYAKMYYTEKEFWSIYDRKWYDCLRQKYYATSLPSVYDKVKLDVEAEKKGSALSWKLWLISLWPINGGWATWKSFQSGDYLLARKSTWKSIEAKDQIKAD
jgi:delta24-sterol reductase